MADLDMNQIQILSSDLRAVSDATYPVKTALASEYNSTSSYNVGDYCMRTGMFYKCNTAIPSGGEVWNAAHWAETSVAESLKNNNNDIISLQTEVENKVLYFIDVAASATTGDIVSLSDARITADHVVTSCVFANPSYIESDVDWTTAAGSLTLSGTCSTATTVSVILIRKDN